MFPARHIWIAVMSGAANQDKYSQYLYSMWLKIIDQTFKVYETALVIDIINITDNFSILV